jgi:hypothetical protein
MHPLHDYVAKQLTEKLKERRVVVWYDTRREFVPFIDEIRGGPRSHGTTVPIIISGSSARLAEYDGSYIELRAIVEPLVNADLPEAVLIYIPGIERDRRNSVLMELEKAGDTFDRPLKWVARQVLRQRYTDGVIDDMLAPERVTYEDLARASSDSTSLEPPSILKAIFHEVSGNDAILAAWLVRDAHDRDIETKEASRELVKLVRSQLGVELPPDAGIPKLRAITLRYVLVGEFRLDLKCPVPGNLDHIPMPKTKEEEAVVRELARRLRIAYPDEYPALADRVETECALQSTPLPAHMLGAIDTFRFEESALLSHCGELIATERFEDALFLVNEREHSFWLDRDIGRKAQWEACRRMADLGKVSLAIRSAIQTSSRIPSEWVDAYTRTDGWYRLDQAQRRLEAWVANLEEEPEERPLGVVRRTYEDVCHLMTEGFTNSLVEANWTTASSLQQTHIFSEVVSSWPKPVAYFLVDALRFEMGVELRERLPKTAEVSVRPAMGSLPSITPIGMAALLPGASGSFSVIAQNGKLGACIEDAFLPDLAARKKFATGRVPKLVDMSLDELLSQQPSKLSKKLEGAQVVVVRSQEIDHAGEAGFTFQARQVMDTVIDNLARAIRKLASTGVEHSVVTADHGHLFFAVDRDESMRLDPPGGDQVELHRRCWVGRGGSTPPGCVRIAASSLGYASDLEFVFPIGCGVFKAGGDLAFHHGGPSLQELIIPVVTVRLKVRESGQSTASPVTAIGLPEVITNRIFSVTLQLGGQNLSLFSNSIMVRPLLMSSGKQVGVAGMAIDAEIDLAGCVKLQAGKPVTLAFLLTDESVPSLRVVVQDPATDAELYRSPTDIPVRLGV